MNFLLSEKKNNEFSVFRNVLLTMTTLILIFSQNLAVFYSYCAMLLLFSCVILGGASFLIL